MTTTTRISEGWLTGFVDGEGCFYVAVLKNASMSLGYQVQLEFVITQHERDVHVLHAIKQFFCCGQASLELEEIKVILMMFGFLEFVTLKALVKK